MSWRDCEKANQGYLMRAAESKDPDFMALGMLENPSLVEFLVKKVLGTESNHAQCVEALAIMVSDPSRVEESLDQYLKSHVSDVGRCPLDQELIHYRADPAHYVNNLAINWAMFDPSGYTAYRQGLAVVSDPRVLS